MRVKRTGGKTLTRVSLVLAVTVVAIVLLLAGSALAAPPWPDAPNAWWISTYGITESQVATVAEGGQDGLFRPAANVTRAQFAKMAVTGLGVATAAPATPTFSDVPPSHFFYPWIEGGAAAGLIAGQIDGSFGPDKPIIRQQANSILGKYLAQKELALRGHIAGKDANYESLNTWYLTEGVGLLAQFSDADRVAGAHAPATAYLVYCGVVQGSNVGGALYLAPGLNLTRGQAVALILRVKAVTFSTALPTITALNPSSGLPAGGNSVTITGTNFTGATAVKFGTKNATSFTVNSNTQITAVAPAGTAGTTVDVTVETAAGTSATTLASKYSYGAPTVTSVSPTAGPVAGGNTVTITGTGFTGVTSVKFGTTNAISFTVDSATQISAVAPAGTAGSTVEVTVTTSAGTSSTAGTANDYTYVNAPTLTALDPNSGPATGGTVVTITGTNFTGATAVKFGTANAISFTVDSATQITAVAPAGTAGSTVEVTVTTPFGTSSTAGTANDYTYLAAYHLEVTGIADPVTAGTVSTVQVRVLNASNSVVTTYTGTVRFSSNDPAAVLPADYTFTSADAGVQIFNVTLKTAGSRTLTVTDMVTPAITGSQTVMVQAAEASSLSIEDAADGTGEAIGDESIASGDSLTVYAVARDAYGNAENVAATWSLTGITGQVVAGDLVPAGDNKSAVFTGNKVGTAVIHAEADGLDDDTGTVTVTSGEAAKYIVTSSKSSVVAGSTVTITAQLADEADNPVKTSGLVVTWSKSDGNGSFDSETSTTDANGVATVEFTTHTVGGTTTTVTATTGDITGESGTISTVDPPELQFVGSASAGFPRARSQSVDIPTDVQDGDLLVAVVGGNSAFTAPEDPLGPSGWTKLASQTGSTTNFSVWYKVRDGDTGSVAWSFSSSVRIGISIAVYRGGFDTTDPIDVFSSTPYIMNDVNLRAASVVTTAANEYLLFAGAWFDSTDRGVTPPGDFTEDVEYRAAASPYMLRYFAHSTSYQADPGATGDKDATLQTALGDNKAAFLIALKPYLD